ncbi:MAG: hypothetical protein HQK87_05460, partial [Nitrospinae bacterium]|nr:hypothetical protein [Nitrospinota bacterium]
MGVMASAMAGLACLLTVAAAPTADDFFADPTMDMVTMAPDGAHIAYRAPFKGRLNIFVADPDGAHGRPLTSFADRSVEHYAWADGGNLVAMKSANGDERGVIYALRADGSRPPVALNPPGAFWLQGGDFRTADGTVYLPFIAAGGISTLLRIDLSTLARSTVATYDRAIPDWHVGPNGALAGSAVVGDGIALLYREPGGRTLRVGVGPVDDRGDVGIGH